MTHLDTSFLVDLFRESARGKRGPASALLDSLADEELAVSVFVSYQLHAGAELADAPERERKRIGEVLEGVRLVQPDESFAPRYAATLARLRRAGRSIATMDLLIATAALVDDARLATRYRRDFSKIDDLVLLTY